jgi:hypothetical protein
VKVGARHGTRASALEIRIPPGRGSRVLDGALRPDPGLSRLRQRRCPGATGDPELREQGPGSSRVTTRCDQGFASTASAGTPPGSRSSRSRPGAARSCSPRTPRTSITTARRGSRSRSSRACRRCSRPSRPSTGSRAPPSSSSRATTRRVADRFKPVEPGIIKIA